MFLLTTSLLPDAGQFINIFRYGIDALLGDDEKLKALLEWAAKKPNLNPDGTPDTRQFFLCLTGYLSARNLIRFRAYHYLDLLVQTFVKRNPDYELDYYLVSALSLTHDLADVNEKKDYIALSHDLPLDIASERYNARVCSQTGPIRT